MQHMFQQSLVLFQFINRVVDIPAAADLGTHSAHCVRPWTFTGTVWLGVTRLFLCNNWCSGWSCRKLWSLRSCSGLASSSSWTSRCTRLCNDWERAMLDSTVDTCCVSFRVAYGRICTIFYVKGWTRFLRSILVASLPVHMPKMMWPRSSSTTSVACFLAGIAGFLHLALCSRRCRHDGMHTVRSVHSRYFSYLSCTWKSVHYFYDPCVFSAFFCCRNFALVDFWGPRALTVVSARGPVVPESLGVSSQVTRHQVLPINNSGVVDMDASQRVVRNNNNKNNNNSSTGLRSR